jgi:uncharacterized protein (TIGR03435 family)
LRRDDQRRSRRHRRQRNRASERIPKAGPSNHAKPPIAARIPAGADGGGPTLFIALEEQLGLKLVKKKASLDVLVIDHADKVPTEN